MRKYLTVLIVLVIPICTFVAGTFVGAWAKLPAGVTKYAAPDGAGYQYLNSPGNVGEFVVDKNFNGHPEHWTLIAQEDKAKLTSFLSHPQDTRWAANEAFYSREPAKAFDIAYWDDDGDERFDAFTFRLRGWCGGDACGGDGNVLLNVLDLDVDGYPETFSCTIFADSGSKGYNYSDIGFDGTWDLSMEFDGRNKRAFFDGEWCDVAGGRPMIDGLSVQCRDATRKIIWVEGRFVEVE